MTVGKVFNTAVLLLLAFINLCQKAELTLALQKSDYHDELKAGPPLGSCADGASPSTTCTNSIDQLRGGGGAINGVDDRLASVIRRFLATSTKDGDDEFYIQGWRWHVMSLIRDAGRLERLSKYLSRHNGEADSEGLSALEQAANYVVNFNMAGLYRIESKLFVKWLRDHLCDGRKLETLNGHNSAEVSKAFRSVINVIDDYRVGSEKMGKELYEKAKKASSPSTNPHQRHLLLNEISRLSTKLSSQLHTLRNLQETLIVPSVARIVSSGEQKSFNNKVLIQLGLLESRTHLVGMHDAVWESGLDDEKKKFESDIPYVARIMIERWRKSLYLPKAGALDYGLDGVKTV